MEPVDFDVHEVSHDERWCERPHPQKSAETVMVRAAMGWQGQGFRPHDCAAAVRA